MSRLLPAWWSETNFSISAVARFPSVISKDRFPFTGSPSNGGASVSLQRAISLSLRRRDGVGGGLGDVARVLLVWVAPF